MLAYPVLHRLEQELAAILVRQMQYLVQCSGCALACAHQLDRPRVKLILEYAVKHQVLAKQLMSLEFGQGFGVFEYFGIEQSFVGIDGFLEGLRAL